MPDQFYAFARTAKDLSRNPLGIIALFILLIYGFACLVLGTIGEHLRTVERLPLIFFLVIFPVVVLGVFYWLVAKHHYKLYGPGDYQNEENFFKGSSASASVRQTSKNKNPEGLSIKNDQDRKPKNDEPGKQGNNPQNIEDLLSFGKGSVVAEFFEMIINRDLKEFDLSTGSTTEKILVKQLAVTRAEVWFDQTYNSIFGSQIALLKLLNERKYPVDSVVMDSYFEKQQQKFPKLFSTWTKEGYLNFLFVNSLIVIEDGNYRITPHGIEFLMVITKKGLSEDRDF
ncbi:hypothetical protein [Desulfoluna butyratoxydans]|uniref:Uncharacterized protein n=1 Tax=Desulfoluna butyratoxydans TaxID=231438 RepID=A0A4V6ILA5_9BACT|nr:hypothetical protein [Desulfoluna butyratoxydans]VFQ44368.1 hypothetical protein MSL71_20170 [Desulfoluna butyratoxydans]